MGKRSDFVRRPMDDYATPYEAVLPLVPFLKGINTFAEPCCGDGGLVEHLESFGMRCVYRGDIRNGANALFVEQFNKAQMICTNPPWTRGSLHALIWHFERILPTWLLFDADWCHCRQATDFLDHCSHIVSVGRVRWIRDTRMSGKDNAAWYRFDQQHTGGPHFYGRRKAAA